MGQGAGAEAWEYALVRKKEKGKRRKAKGERQKVKGKSKNL
jgi:hypothetical protein